MKWLTSFFKSKASPEELASECLRNATEKCDKGDLDGAIQTLKDAYALIKQTSTSHPIETFLRLPLYLQKAGRFEEALSEFDKLIHEGYPNMTEGAGLRAFDRSTIYDKMRLTYQREKKAAEAAVFGVLSHAFKCVALKMQKRKEDLNFECSRESWKNIISGLLKKAKLIDMEEQALGICLAFSKTCSESDLSQLQSTIQSLLKVRQ